MFVEVSFGCVPEGGMWRKLLMVNLLSIFVCIFFLRLAKFGNSLCEILKRTNENNLPATPADSKFHFFLVESK